MRCRPPECPPRTPIRRLGFWIIASLALIAAVASPDAVAAGRRVALLVGNAAYREARLVNPLNDIAAMKSLLVGGGFEVMTESDASFDTMIEAIDKLRAAAAGAEVAIFYYSGHGVSLQGDSYLLPVDIDVGKVTDTRLRYRAVPAVEAIEAVRAADALGLVLLDACRDNPFPARLASRSKGSFSKGVARIDLDGADARNIMVSYATSPGQTAEDGDGTASPYAQALVAHLLQPDTPIEVALRNVAADVYQRTRRRQLPYINGTILSAVYLGTPVVAAAAAPAPQQGLAIFGAIDMVPPALASLPVPIPPPTPIPPIGQSIAAVAPPALQSMASARPRVSMMEENPVAGSQPLFSTGEVVWQVVKESQSGKPPTSVLRARVEIPDRRITMTLSMQPNTDPTFSASHLIEVRLSVPSDFDGKGIANVPGLIMKPTEQATGSPLIGASAKISANFFWFALAAGENDKQRNLRLLKDSGWMSVPIVYETGKRGLITIEKTSVGDEALTAALAAWNAPTVPPKAEQGAAAMLATGLAYTVQVTAQRSPEEAERQITTLRQRFPVLLGMEADVVRTDFGARGLYFRSRFGRFASQSEAAQLCDTLKTTGTDCMVLRR